jgi:hypothetical protein
MNDAAMYDWGYRKQNQVLRAMSLLSNVQSSTTNSSTFRLRFHRETPDPILAQGNHFEDCIVIGRLEVWGERVPNKPSRRRRKDGEVQPEPYLRVTGVDLTDGQIDMILASWAKGAWPQADWIVREPRAGT